MTGDGVKLLESRLRCDKNIPDKYFLGGVLFVLCSRARWGDLSCMQAVEFDIIEVSSSPFGFRES